MLAAADIPQPPQDQLKKLFDLLPAIGSLHGADGNAPDTLWTATHTWGVVIPAGVCHQETTDCAGTVDCTPETVTVCSHEPVEGWNGEYRYTPDGNWMIHNDWIAKSYTLSPVMKSGYIGEFVTLMAPLVTGAFSAQISALVSQLTGAVAGTSPTTQLASDVASETGTMDFSFDFGGDAGSSLDVGGGFDGSVMPSYNFDIGSFGDVADPAAGAIGTEGTGFDFGDLSHMPDVGFEVPDLQIPEVTGGVSSGIPGIGSLSDLFKTAVSAYQVWQQYGGQHPKVGVQTRVNANGSTVTPNKNGTITTTYANGHTTTTQMPRGVPYAFPDGTVVMNNGNGTYSVIGLDGTAQTVHYPAGAGGGLLGGNNTLLLVGLGVGALLLLRR